MYDLQLFLLMAMPFIVLLCIECNAGRKKQQPVPIGNNENDEVAFEWDESNIYHEYRDEKYRNVYIDMDVLMLMCNIVDERVGY